MNERTPLDHARDLQARGLSPIPVPYKSKAPVIAGWPTLRLTSDDLPRYFNGAPCNVGTLLGESARWIVDVDIDNVRAVELADTYLPRTGMVWGREGKPRSHRLYRLTCPAHTKKWTSKPTGMIVELRSTGCQSIAPGSTHPSGESVRWYEDGEPASIDPAELMAAIEALANAVLAELGEGPPDNPPHGSDNPGSPVPRPKPPGGGSGPSNYGREALRREVARVAATAEGTRNDSLNRAAFNVGTLIGGDEVDRAEAEAELSEAARACGLPDAEAGRTIASGIASGMKQPRQRPDAGRRAGSDGSKPTMLVPSFDPIRASDLIREYPDLRPVVIAGLLRQGEVINVVAAPKVGKSWLIHAMALALVSGQAWLGKATTQGRVLLIDAELHRETLASRLRKTQSAVAVTDEEMGSLDVWAVRGQGLTIDGIADAMEAREPGEYSLIVVDALYRFMPPDGEENSNETMTRVYNTLDRIAKHTGAAIVVVHHATKGSQADKAVTDVGAGAGSQSRAADSHLILRPHEVDDAVVVDAVVRSFAPMDSFVIRSTKPGWELAPDLDPTELRKPARRGRGAAAETEAPAKEPARIWTPENFATEIVGRERSIRDDVIARGVEQGLGKGQADSLLKRAMAAGKVFRYQDTPSSSHRFSIDPPTTLMGDDPGGILKNTQPPGAVAPGGYGGESATV